MRHILTFLALLLALGGNMLAQNTVSGTLHKADSDQAVAYANIAMLRQTDSTFLRGTTSDDRGRFELAGDTVPTLLRISAIGFETLWLPVADSTAASAVNLGIIALKEGATTLDAVEIVAKKPLYAADGEKKIYNVSEDPTVQSGTAQDALQNAPGVQVDEDGNITLNGKEVVVYINDKESHYTGDMLKQYIKTLTADQISSIEAIEYPSAKYGGSTPVINIHTTQKMLRNSYLSFGGYGSSKPSFSPFLSYAYANEKLRFDTYVRYSHNRWDSHSDGDGSLLAEDSSVVRDYSYTSSSQEKGHDINVNFSFGYDFDSMNTLSAYASVGPSWDNSNSDDRYRRRDSIAGSMQDFSYNEHSDYTSHYLWGYGSIDFEHKFNNDGHRISFSAGGNVSRWGNNSNNTRTYDVQTPLNYAEHTESSSPSGSLDLDVSYSLPYSEHGELSAGLSHNIGFDHNYGLRDTLATDGLYHCDYLRSDTSESPSHSTSLYLSWRRKWGHFTLRLGGNLGYYHSSSSHQGLPQYDTTANYLSFRPSVLLMYNTESMHSFSLNYSYSHSYPSADDFSRYVSYGIDSYSSGNPLLQPSYTHRLGLSYDKSFEQGHSLGISANYTWDRDKRGYLSMPVFSPFFGHYVTYSQPYNTGNSRDGNIYAYARWRFSAYLSTSLSAGLSDNWYRIQLRPGEWFEDEMASWNIRLNLRAKLFNLVWVSLSSHYNSRSHGWSALQISEPRWGMDFSASADLFDRRLSLYLNFNDIFNTNSWNSSNINPYAPSTSNYTYNSQYITFGVTLRFGKMELGNSSNEGIQSSGGGKGGN